jgi:hypothetical protein
MEGLGLVPELQPGKWLERSGEPQSSLTANKKSNRRARDDISEEVRDLVRHLPAK